MKTAEPSLTEKAVPLLSLDLTDTANVTLARYAGRIATLLTDATIKEECKSDYPHALQALWKALDRVEDLIQN